MWSKAWYPDVAIGVDPSHGSLSLGKNDAALCGYDMSSLLRQWLLLDVNRSKNDRFQLDTTIYILFYDDFFPSLWQNMKRFSYQTKDCPK